MKNKCRTCPFNDRCPREIKMNLDSGYCARTSKTPPPDKPLLYVGYEALRFLSIVYQN